MKEPHNTSSSLSPYRWVILALLFFATTIIYIDRQIMSLIKSQLDTEFKWTNEQYGWVQSAFQGSYALGLMSFGWFIDRFGTKKGYAISIGARSVSAAFHFLIGAIAIGCSFSIGSLGFDYPSRVILGAIGCFCLARVALGFSEGGNFPAAIKTVSQWFPRSDRAFATTLFNSGSNVGALIAPAVFPIIAVVYGWRYTFLIASLLGIIWLCFWLPLFKKAPQLAEEEVAAERKIPWASLLGIRQTWAYMIAKFLTDPVWWFYLIWLPDYFKKQQHLDIKAMGLPLVTLYGIVTVLSILAGWGVKKVADRGYDMVKVRKGSLLIFALCSLPIFFVRGLGMWEAVLLIGFAASAHQAWSASLYAAVSETFPRDAVGSASGLGGMAGSLGGMIFPIVAGRILDASDNGYSILFSFCAFAYIVAFVIHHLLLPRLEKAKI